MQAAARRRTDDTPDAAACRDAVDTCLVAARRLAAACAPAGTAEDAVLPWAFAADADRWAAAASARPRGARLVMVVLCRLPERRRPRASRAARPSWLSAQSAARCAERGPSAAAPSASSDAVPA